jgi:predicted site-specific integrase-resolvase
MNHQESLEPVKLLNAEELSKRLNVSLKTINDWVKHKTVPVIKIKDFIRFDYTKVINEILKHEIPATPAS